MTSLQEDVVVALFMSKCNAWDGLNVSNIFKLNRAVTNEREGKARKVEMLVKVPIHVEPFSPVTGP